MNIRLDGAGEANIRKKLFAATFDEAQISKIEMAVLRSFQEGTTDVLENT
ncbi:hypothetical protein [Rhizobium sp. SL42]|nr:hypothetical protein [Rhizobium sp. SL42]UJW75868.1 hypothetical protein IM739_05050 [Rhizobium sp. SL42]